MYPLENETPNIDSKVDQNGSTKSDDDNNGCCLTRICAHRYRYFILILGCFCLTSICSNMITLNFTFICMKREDTSDNVSATPFMPSEVPQWDSLNASATSKPQVEYYYSQHEKSLLIWAVAIASIFATFPFTVLYSKFGAKYVLLFAGLLSATSTALVPLAVEMGIYPFLALRICQGISYAAVFAAIGVLCSRWASLKQNGLFISVLTCFSYIASSITNPVAGALCESSFGWQAVYYSHSVVSFILFSLWFLFYSDHPSTHKRVTTIEIEKIHRNKTQAHINMDSYVPYRQIITNPIVLCVWLNALADIGSAIFLSTYMPTYINSVLHYSIAETGILGALPSILHIPTKLIAGYLSDKLKGYNERNKMIAFNCIALVLPGFMFAAVGFVPDEYPMIAVLLFTLINIFFGANCGGFYKCGSLISRQYSGFVISNIQFIKCLSLFLAPALVSIFVSDDTDKSQWRTIFIFFAVLILFANALFCYMATDKPASFTLLTRQSKKLKSAKNQNTKVFDFPLNETKISPSV